MGDLLVRGSAAAGSPGSPRWAAFAASSRARTVSSPDRPAGDQLHDLRRALGRHSHRFLFRVQGLGDRENAKARKRSPASLFSRFRGPSRAHSSTKSRRGPIGGRGTGAWSSPSLSSSCHSSSPRAIRAASVSTLAREPGWARHGTEVFRGRKLRPERAAPKAVAGSATSGASDSPFDGMPPRGSASPSRPERDLRRSPPQSRPPSPLCPRPKTSGSGPRSFAWPAA